MIVKETKHKAMLLLCWIGKERKYEYEVTYWLADVPWPFLTAVCQVGAEVGGYLKGPWILLLMDGCENYFRGS